MKVFTPEISWHHREPIFCVDIQNKINFIESEGHFYRVVTGGGDNSIVIWRVKLNKNKQNDLCKNKVLLDVMKQNCLNLKSTNKKNKPIDLNAVCVLNMHIRTVNVVRFGPITNVLASGADDSYVYIYKLAEEQILDSNLNQEDKKSTTTANGSLIEDDELICLEKWKRTTILRRHIEDVVDLAWSPDEKFLITGSVDNTSFIWNVTKGEVIYSLLGHNGYIQGVAWDPLNSLIATLCSDRNLRIFDTNKKIIAKIDKLQLNNENNENNENSLKSSFLFHDERLVTCSRRLSFSPNGELLIAPTGIIEINEEVFQNAVHLFVRNNIKKLHCYFPTNDFSTSVKFCNKMFKLKENLKNPYPFPYRLIFAIATKNSIFIYDTQQPYPIAEISDIHYTKLSDISWSADARILIVSSTDGYCTLIFFDPNELGEFYEGEPYKFQTEASKTSTSSVKKTKKEEQTNSENSVKISSLKITNFFQKVTSMSSPQVKTENMQPKKYIEEEMEIEIISSSSNLQNHKESKKLINCKQLLTNDLENKKKTLDEIDLKANLNKTKQVVNIKPDVNIIQVKRKPKNVDSNLNQFSSSELSSTNSLKTPNNNQKIKIKFIKDQDQSLRLKRKQEADLDSDLELKKKNMKINSESNLFQQTNDLVISHPEILL